MKRIILSTAIFFAISLNAQIKFEKGYVITKFDNQKKEVLIKNLDWVNSPTEIVYKLITDSKEVKGDPSNIKEFKIYGFSKYVSFSGSIDTSSTDLSNLSNYSEPENKDMVVFLKEVVSGAKNLYSYQGSSSAAIYFYSENSENDIKPLIYKQYHPDGNQSLIAINKSYIDQLKNIFAVGDTSVSNVKYNSNSLSKVFTTYNSKTSDNVAQEAATENSKKLIFNLSLRPGFNFYSPLKTNNLLGDSEFSSKSNFRVGLEAELVLPFNKNKWSIIFEPTYSFYTSDKISAPTANYLYTMNMESYSFVNLPLGFRHYMYLNNKSKLFFNAQSNIFTISTGKAKSIDLKYEEQKFDEKKISTNQVFKSFSFGVGYNYNNKYVLEARYNTANNLLESNIVETAKFSYMSLILGYNLF